MNSYLGLVQKQENGSFLVTFPDLREHRLDRPPTHDALTIKPDHSVGAVQVPAAQQLGQSRLIWHGVIRKFLYSNQSLRPVVSIKGMFASPPTTGPSRRFYWTGVRSGTLGSNMRVSY